MNKRLMIALALLVTQSSAFAQIPLQTAREEVTKKYVLDLQHADYKDIIQLFANDGYVISTSRGKMNAKEFFYSFLPEIVSAKTDLHQIYQKTADDNVMAARFHFEYKMKNGETGSGEYVDEFTFADHSTKLKSVYMFENTRFDIA
jgi:hypothetical protein